MQSLYARRRDADHVERLALAAFNRHKSERGVPREIRSVHYQLPTTREQNPSKRLGADTILAGKTKHEHVAASLGQSAECAAQPLRAWRAPRANDKAGWTTEQPPQRVAFGTKASRSTETSKARELRIWRERVARETRAKGEVDDDLDGIIAELDIEPARPLVTSTAYDMVNGQRERVTRHCAKCGVDRFYCPHKARAAP
jgi:hypothetical protein